MSAGSMILQGLIKKPSLKTSTARSTGKPEVTLALSIVLVILIILLIISIFLLLYCVLKRQGERAERRKRGDYERRRQVSVPEFVAVIKQKIISSSFNYFFNVK